MAIDLTPEQRETGSANYVRATEGLTRRGFMKSMAVAGLAAVPVSAAVYFGYESLHGRPVKAALIGGGDEGGVLVGEHNPEYLQFVAVCDIRPSNMTRIFEGEPAPSLRKGFNRIYGKSGRKGRFANTPDYLQMLKNEPEIEAVVIATPLCWHAKMAIDVMNAGKERGWPIHVLCEKLMGWNITQCKAMVKTAEDTGSILAVGHQRHYSLLYAHAVEILKNDILGDIKYISAPWHRNNAWAFKPSDKQKEQMVREVVQPFYKDGWFNPVLHEDYDKLNGKTGDYHFDSVEQLIRWRLFQLDGRRSHGGAGQPPARRVQHLPRPRPSAGRQRHRRQVFLRPSAGLRRNQRLRLPDQLERPRLRRPGLPDLRVPRPEPPARPQPRDGRRRPRHRHLLVDQHQRLRDLRRVRQRDARHDDRGPRVVGAAVPGAESLRGRPGRRAGHHGQGR